MVIDVMVGSYQTRIDLTAPARSVKIDLMMPEGMKSGPRADGWKGDTIRPQVNELTCEGVILDTPSG